jgi:adenosylhomocysteinase
MNGQYKIEWAGKHMPVVTSLAKDLAKSELLAGVRISACLHVTAESANLLLALRSGGADVALCASNPLSTQDDVVAVLKKRQLPVFAKHGADKKLYYQHIKSALAIKPNLTVDDGADLVTYIHTKARSLLKHIVGGTEETTTGVIRLRAMAKAGKLKYPIVAVNSALTKHLFDNRYGTGQSTIDGILRSTNILLAGSCLVVAGYGWCGKGVAARAKGMNARVIVTEVDPVKALEAVMDGYEVMSMKRAAKLGDIFVTTTGNRDIITRQHLTLMKDGVILANSGHFDVEINVMALGKLASRAKEVRNNLTEYTLRSGKTLYLVTQGRLANLGAAEGHPAAVMDMSFANQILALRFLAERAGKLPPAVYDMPKELDEKVAVAKLKSLGVKIDALSPAQQKYLSGWKAGT